MSCVCSFSRLNTRPRSVACCWWRVAVDQYFIELVYALRIVILVSNCDVFSLRRCGSKDHFILRSGWSFTYTDSFTVSVEWTRNCVSRVVWRGGHVTTGFFSCGVHKITKVQIMLQFFISFFIYFTTMYPISLVTHFCNMWSELKLWHIEFSKFEHPHGIWIFSILDESDHIL